MKNFLDLADHPRETILELLALAARLERHPEPQALAGRVLGLLFFNSSLRTLRHDTIIWDIAFSPDNRQLATASDDDFTAWLWDVESSIAPVALPTYGAPVLALAF